MAVIIPAYNPTQTLVLLVDALLLYDFAAVIVVDDGSATTSDPVFAAVAAHPRVTLLRHAINTGKGRALKTAFNHCLLHERQLLGVVTADADGQHSPHDITRVATALAETPAAMVLGVREFGQDVPLRSRFGNSLTRLVFRLLYGLNVRDTQTGLRALPLTALPSMLKVPGERYEYESSMLIDALRYHRPLREVVIKTIYLDGNSSSHFNVIRDSMKIYFVLLRFTLSSLSTSVVDFLVFSLAFLWSGSLAAGMLCGRTAALGVNFALNKRMVFRQRGGGYGVLVQYLALVVLLASISYLSIQELQAWFGLSTLMAKLLAESLLFIVSFSVQHDLIFAAFHNERDVGSL
jgi:glycosyltransferase involved in cell wall biosynthesis